MYLIIFQLQLRWRFQQGPVRPHPELPSLPRGHGEGGRIHLVRMRRRIGRGELRIQGQRSCKWIVFGRKLIHQIFFMFFFFRSWSAPLPLACAARTERWPRRPGMRSKKSMEIIKESQQKVLCSQIKIWSREIKEFWFFKWLYVYLYFSEFSRTQIL